MGHGAEVPEHLREYFGHDKVALHGTGAMPAAPPAPPGSTARRAGEAALADALAKAGTPGRRPGDRPAVVAPRPGLVRGMRAAGERALMEASQKSLGTRIGAPVPHAESAWYWRALFVPVYRAMPWELKRRMVGITSGVKRWRE